MSPKFIYPLVNNTLCHNPENHNFKILIKQSLMKWSVEIWTELIWLWIGTRDWASMNTAMNTLRSIKDGKFLN